jgi:hypothetical protein
VTTWRIPAGRPRRQFSTARIRAMFADFLEDPTSFSDEQRRRLLEGFEWMADVVDRDPIVHEAVTGTAEIAAYLDGRPGTERREG